jgi:hypothetical protein
LPKLTEAALQAQAKGDDSVNVFKLILSDYRDYFIDFSRRYSIDYKVPMRLTNLGILNVLEANKNPEYAAAALQNLVGFSNNYWLVDLLNDLKSEYKIIPAAMSSTVKDIVVHSLDGHVLTYLIYNTVNTSTPIQPLSKELLGQTLHYLSTPEFIQRTRTKNFLLSQKEKAAWKNFSPGSRYDSSVCYVMQIVERDLAKLPAEMQKEAEKFISNAAGLKKTLCANENQ